MNGRLVPPCGTYCGTCKFLNRKEKPNCSGCGNQKGEPFWGKCKLYACAKDRVEHCGMCEDFPCDLFVDQFDPAHGQKSVFTRGGLLAYRRRVGTQRFIEMSQKLVQEDERKNRVEDMKGRIGLVTVLTNNIQSLKSFYSDVLGFSIQTDLGNYVEFGSEGVRFVICEKEVMKKATNHLSYQEQRKGQSFELAFPVGSPEDVDRTYSEIVAKGATPIKEPEMMPWGRKTAFFADPDGNIHEIYSYKPEDFKQ
jgi:catechol 2,3-dioxygenase-like lactoylglutathione lyase family enzyme